MMSFTRFVTLSVVVIAAILFSGCMVGPDYKTPDTSEQIPAAWKWQKATPRDDAPKGDWWKIFKDPILNQLEERTLGKNQQLKASLARVEQAAAAAKREKINLAPDLRLSPTVTRERTSANLPTPFPIREIPSAYLNTFAPVFTLNYEVDLWGRVRRGIESADAEFLATAADSENLQLSLTAELASNYFLIRGYDAELAVLQETYETRERTTELLRLRFEAGAIPEVDLARARSEVAVTRADLAAVKGRRDETLNTLALLCGEPASTFELKSRPGFNSKPPKIKAGVPLSLLERRPDIATAERLVASSNANIGVATANYFPKLTLIGDAGYLSKDIDLLFTPESLVWSIAPKVSLPITGLSAVRVNVKRATAAREEAVANYRQAILSAVADVETSLTQIRQTGEQYTAQNEALKESTRAADLIRQSYDRGATSFLDMLDASRTRLHLQRRTALLNAQEHIATVRLIKALGGEW
jgi:multidrug efflux system outer membrane protein